MATEKTAHWYVVRTLALREDLVALLLKKQIEIVIKETQKNRAPETIASKYGFDTVLTEQIARLYLTHPGVDADGIKRKMGY